MSRGSGSRKKKDELGTRGGAERGERGYAGGQAGELGYTLDASLSNSPSRRRLAKEKRIREEFTIESP